MQQKVGENMAKTLKGKKKVYVHGYKKKNGTKVPQHYRSTNNQHNGYEKKSYLEMLFFLYYKLIF